VCKALAKHHVHVKIHRKINDIVHANVLKGHEHPQCGKSVEEIPLDLIDHVSVYVDDRHGVVLAEGVAVESRDAVGDETELGEAHEGREDIGWKRDDGAVAEVERAKAGEASEEASVGDYNEVAVEVEIFEGGEGRCGALMMKLVFKNDKKTTQKIKK
jgi:hypothetical protein